MKTIATIGLAALLFASPTLAFAHDGMLHEGCPAGQTFTIGELTVSGAFSRATLPSAKAAGGFLTITNAGESPDRLIGAASDVAGTVELHEMKMDGDMMKMSPIEGGIAVPAGESVTLAPGGLHIMFIGLNQSFDEGACVEVTLTFEQAGELPVVLNVGGIAAGSAEPMHQSH